MKTLSTLSISKADFAMLCRRDADDGRGLGQRKGQLGLWSWCFSGHGRGSEMLVLGR